ncbi:fimbrial protein [Escherichia coli]|uniref:fimbrial protein n=1 Tax=Escherichia coli TaxID=562 RepID=UPI003A93D06E
MRAIAMGCLILIMATGISQPALANVEFTGNLLDRPCQVDPALSSQNVWFLDTAVPLYHVTPGRSSQKPFVIRLINCHATTYGKTVKLILDGQKESALPGYLAVSGINKGRLGIGILDTDGSTLLKLGDVHNLGDGNKVVGNTVILNLKAYVQASPQAIMQRSVQSGAFSAMAIFTLNYQ